MPQTPCAPPLHSGSSARDDFYAATSDVDVIVEFEYLGNHDLRFAVERNFITIGEAMASLRRHYPDTASKVENQVAVVNFRNFLVHPYWAIDDAEVWLVVQRNVPLLGQVVATLLE